MRIPNAAKCDKPSPELALTRAQLVVLERLTKTGFYGVTAAETAELLLGVAIRSELQKGFGR